MTRDFEQDARMRSLIVRLNLISHVPASNPNPGGGKATDESPGGKQPRGGGRSGADWWAIYLRADDPGRVIEEAKNEIKHAVLSGGDRDVEESAEELTARIRELRSDGFSVKEIAYHCRCTERRVRQAEEAPITPEEAASVADVLTLYRREHTVRYIAQKTGISKSEVHRIIKGKRAA